jgi:hypothetical protein
MIIIVCNRLKESGLEQFFVGFFRVIGEEKRREVAKILCPKVCKPKDISTKHLHTYISVLNAT